MIKKTAFLAMLLAIVVFLTVFSVPAQAARGAWITPTVTPSPTVAPSVTATATALAPELIDVNGMKAWCLPKGSVVTKAQWDTDTPAANARPMKLENETPTLFTGDDACIFLYSATAPIAEGTQLQVADASKAVWLKADLVAGTQPNTAYAALVHGYIVDPPFWSVTYTMRVVTKDGAELWSSPVVFRRGYEPGKCWDGKWPDPVTWYCYTPPDPHPWDPYYKFVNPKP